MYKTRLYEHLQKEKPYTVQWRSLICEHLRLEKREITATNGRGVNCERRQWTKTSLWFSNVVNLIKPDFTHNFKLMVIHN